MAKAAAMKPGSGGGPIQNAKGQSTVKQAYGKGGAGSKMNPPKKPGKSGDNAVARKGSPLAKKKK